ncbi:DEAD/DEAH box helicase [Albimonas sp. CAU 1670]|uniref:DEAD/DEAH box helicase n=1 Tax=Albimonas sp. CAU 1670 TaxID=3032599 RepID=UPI0023DB9EE8|nr:DEAD/DEAH box helicase [Albimonas sp. CAU 1670]MDF2232264.1 DEAD/DEAH box helicase [Albimonas sp. CAU 1670]
MTTFSDLPLAEPLKRALEEEGYATPTPIQVQAIPPALEGRDILGIAQTGTGKTAAFALPLLDMIQRNRIARPTHSCRVLVLAPTRELANQIAESFRTYGRHIQLRVETVFGGVSINKQIRAMKGGADVLVATPGRLEDLIDQGAMTLSKVEALVLDEADQMMDMGFIHALKRIVKMLPKQRRTLFFSATMPKAIAELAGQYLDNPVKVSVAPQSTTAEKVAQRAHFVRAGDKQALLNVVLRQEDYDRVLIFTRTKHGADRVVKNLGRANVEAKAIHGNKRQNERERVLEAFRNGSLRVLVATDIAARGVDVPGVSHVINYEIPNVPEQYVHRIGRTARAGAEGIAISFVADDERPYMRDIEKVTRQKVPTAPLPEAFAAEAAEVGSRHVEAGEDQRGPRGRQGQGQGRGQGGRGRQVGGRGQGAPGRGAGKPVEAGAERSGAARPARGPKPAKPAGGDAPRRGQGGGPRGEGAEAPRGRRGPRRRGASQGAPAYS